MKSPHAALNAIRDEIERVDRALLARLAERLELARRAGAVNPGVQQQSS